MSTVIFGISWNNGLRYNGAPFPWCGISKPTAIAHLTFALVCFILFLIIFFLGWIVPLVLFILAVVFLITGIVIFLLSLGKK